MDKLLEVYQTSSDIQITIAGLNKDIARKIAEETGANMQAFGNQKKQAKWTCVCPGNLITLKLFSDETFKSFFRSYDYTACYCRRGCRKSTSDARDQIMVLYWHTT